ncbi:NADH:flavin oxidoreductase/NADH oxidase [Halalkalirubrum salinum]|uniref:NADH:flavin oxidoreductase/NADH oxidase n=1 Tax=Halalkalirubrum salinum TaxID=2563889 RepID=UPI0010FAEDDA|nr:NADH:flavin oxidoreductase/NADH oxidase [Halalkalirubrum salinum]
MVSSLFSSLRLAELTIPNRIFVSPMCQYSCEDRDGLATNWHLVHLGSRATGGSGIVLAEATAVAPDGRITPEDLGLWSNEHAEALRPTVEFIKSQGSIPGIQLSHAGRKASKTRPWEGGVPLQPSGGGWSVIAPSEVPWPYDEEPPKMRVMTETDIDRTVEQFRDAAEYALEAGFQIIELHAAHGYLLHEFLSPYTNRRDDKYGGSFENRIRFPMKVIKAVSEVWPAENPLMVRISATDWIEEGESWTLEQSVRLVQRFADAGVDLIDVSTGALDPVAQNIPQTGPNYQVPFGETIRKQADVAVGTVGGITSPQQADAIVRNERADAVIIGREHLRDPYFALHAAEELGVEDEIEWPDPYAYAV